ncbi:MAG: hypothetical protein QOH48_1602 [Actinomycetota bacterium]|jgi:hypothetical protein|nr:hypothetical protein [Actinomycetota bacterium]
MTIQMRAWGGAVAGLIATADATLYLVIIHNQGDLSPVVPWVFSIIVLGAFAAICAAFSASPRASSMLLAGSAALFLVLGVLGIFSIGSPLLLAAAFSFLGVAQTRRPHERPSRWRTGVVFGAVGVGVLATTFLVVQIATGGQKISVTCSGSAQGSGMPRLATGGPQDSARRPHPCRTITSP